MVPWGAAVKPERNTSALEAAGVEFIDETEIGPGVRLGKRQRKVVRCVAIFEGSFGLISLNSWVWSGWGGHEIISINVLKAFMGRNLHVCD